MVEPPLTIGGRGLAYWFSLDSITRFSRKKSWRNLMIHKNIPTPDNFKNRGGDEKRRFSYGLKRIVTLIVARVK
jgi:hypothetical protein